MSSPVARSYKTYLTMAENDEAEPATTERLRFKDEEEAAGGGGPGHRPGRRASMAAGSKRPQLARQSTAISEDSMSIRPPSRRQDPSAALPIQYRTL